MGTSHEYRDKNGDLVRVRESTSGKICIDAYKRNERDPQNHERLTVKTSSGDGKPTGHGKTIHYCNIIRYSLLKDL